MPNLRNGSKGDSNPGSLDCESGILPLSYCAPLADEVLCLVSVLASRQNANRPVSFNGRVHYKYPNRITKRSVPSYPCCYEVATWGKTYSCNNKPACCLLYDIIICLCTLNLLCQ